MVGAALGRYSGTWAHDETRKSLDIAGANVVDAPAFSVPIGSLAAKQPRENAALVADLDDALTKLAAEAGETFASGTAAGVSQPSAADLSVPGARPRT